MTLKESIQKCIQTKTTPCRPRCRGSVSDGSTTRSTPMSIIVMMVQLVPMKVMPFFASIPDSQISSI
jgi:hypothetical protein